MPNGLARHNVPGLPQEKETKKSPSCRHVLTGLLGSLSVILFPGAMPRASTLRPFRARGGSIFNRVMIITSNDIFTHLCGLGAFAIIEKSHNNLIKIHNGL